MSKKENFTETVKEPRIGAGHPNLDPALLDPKPLINTPKSEPAPIKPPVPVKSEK